MGMKVGDEIEKVNEKSVRYSTHAQIVTTIHEVTEFFMSTSLRLWCPHVLLYFNICIVCVPLNVCGFT